MNKVKVWGYSVNCIHGGMKLDERVEAEKVFKHQTQIMVATEAAGEGINLQFCHIMVNYDIPWNPNRLEQRMGRIHRYGQQKEVHIFNLVAGNTREGMVLNKMFDKLDEIRKAMGSDKVFDIIGDVFQGKNLYQLIMEAVANTRNLDEIIAELDIKVDEEYNKEIKKALGESLATRNIDYTRITELTEKAKEYRLIPEYVEEFFKKGFAKAEGKIKPGTDKFLSIDSVPYNLRRICNGIDFKKKFGVILKSYPKATFDKDLAFKNPDSEFISFGHSLLESLLEWVNENYYNKFQKGALFEDPSCEYDGVYWFFEGEIKYGKGHVAGKKLIAIYDDGKQLKEVNPAILWDFVTSDKNVGVDLSVNPNISKDRATEYAYKAVEEYKFEILEERKRQGDIKRKYGVKSLDFLIHKLGVDLSMLYDRQALGEKVELSIRNKDEKKKEYEHSLTSLQKEIEQECSLTTSMPKFSGAVYVRPLMPCNADMASDEEIEAIGKKVSMDYERNNGRVPEDVSKENLGFDIRSKGESEKRYIEVKARKDEGLVVLTPNEWFKANRFKEEYWLYVVANAVTNPTLYIINNPALNLNVQEKIEVVRFLVPTREWKNKGEVV